MFSRSNNSNNVMRLNGCGSSSSGSSTRNSNDFVNDNKILTNDVNGNKEKSRHSNKDSKHQSTQNQNGDGINKNDTQIYSNNIQNNHHTYSKNSLNNNNNNKQNNKNNKNENDKSNISLTSEVLDNTSNNSYNSANVNHKSNNKQNNNNNNKNHNNDKKDRNLKNTNNKITEPCCATVSPNKSPDVSRPNKSREDRFQRNFPEALGPHDVIIKTYHCAYVSDNFLQGYLYITSRYFCFYSKLFHKKKLIKIPLNQVVSMSKKKTVKVIPNAVGVATNNKEYSFGSLLSRDKTYKTMLKTWNLYKINNANNSGASSNEDERTSLDDSHSLTHQSGSTSLEETIDDSDSIQNPPSIPASETDNWLKADLDSSNKNKEGDDEDEWMKDDPTESSRKWDKHDDDCGVSHISNFQPHRHHIDDFDKLDGCDKKDYYQNKCLLQKQIGEKYDQASYLHIIVSIIQFCTLKNLSTPLKTYFFLLLTSILIIFLLFSTVTLNIHLNYLQDLFEKLDKDGGGSVSGYGGSSCSSVGGCGGSSCGGGRGSGGSGGECQGYGDNGNYRNVHKDGGCCCGHLTNCNVKNEDLTLRKCLSGGNGADDIGRNGCIRGVDDGTTITRKPNENNADTSFITLTSLHEKLIIKMQSLVKLLDKSSEAHGNNK